MLPPKHSPDRLSNGEDGPVDSCSTVRAHRILFVKLSSFSYTNDRILEQLPRHFPGCGIVIFDVKDDIRQKFGLKALNAMIGMSTYGPSVLQNASQRHAFSF